MPLTLRTLVEDEVSHVSSSVFPFLDFSVCCWLPAPEDNSTHPERMHSVRPRVRVSLTISSVQRRLPQRCSASCPAAPPSRRCFSSPVPNTMTSYSLAISSMFFLVGARRWWKVCFGMRKGGWKSRDDNKKKQPGLESNRKKKGPVSMQEEEQCRGFLSQDAVWHC